MLLISGLATSKYPTDRSLYGRTGTFLCSLAALSILSITSHHHEHRSSTTVIFHHSRPISRLDPAPPHQALANRDHGTRVSVRDLFGNMPVRIKQRPILEQGGKQDSVYLNALKKQLVGLILAWGGPIRIHVSSATSPAQVRLYTPTERRPAQSLASPSHPDLISVHQILSQAGYIDLGAHDFWMKISTRTSEVALQGAISLIPAANKAVQFISLGILPVASPQLEATLMDKINRSFAMSRFGDEGYAFDIDNPRPKDNSQSQRVFYKSQSPRAGRKALDRWPRFVLRITVNDATGSNLEGEDSLLGNQIMLAKALKVIGVATFEFLQKYGFKPRAPSLARRRHPIQAMPNTPSSPTASDVFRTWSRIKSSVSQSFSDTKHWKSDSSPSLLTYSELSATKPTVPVSSASVDDQGSEERSPGTPIIDHAADGQDCSLTWQDPSTRVPLFINARTGFGVRLKAKNVSSVHIQPVDCQESRLNTWGKKIIDGWKNPVFNTSEQSIARVSNHDSDAQATAHACNSHNPYKDDASLGTLSLAQYTRQGLKQSRVIAQVDQKFILVDTVTTPPSSKGKDDPEQRGLILIDQHAAAERIRVEELLSRVCDWSSHTTSNNNNCSDSQTALLPNALLFEISSQELPLFRRFQSYFDQWGILYTISETHQEQCGESSSSFGLSVQSLPPLIAERCRSQPKILIDLLRREIWDPDSARRSLLSGNPPVSVESESALKACDPDFPSWLTKLHQMPRGMLSMLNSRACRSAIMFNDHLELTECENLVKQLAETRFPFQCAHGRPSIIPLVALSNRNGVVGDADSGNPGSLAKALGSEGLYEDIGFLQAYKKSVQHDV